MIAKVFCLALCIATAAATKGWTSCSPATASFKIKSINIEGCDMAPCTFTSGKSYQIAVLAVADRVTTTLNYKVNAYIGDTSMVIREGNACDNLVKGSCPTGAGKEFEFGDKLDVPKEMPELNTMLTAVLNDDKDGVVICIKFGIKTVQPEST